MQYTNGEVLRETRTGCMIWCHDNKRAFPAYGPRRLEVGQRVGFDLDPERRYVVMTYSGGGQAPQDD